MDFEQVLRISKVPWPSTDLEYTYRMPVSTHGGIHQALVDTGSLQTLRCCWEVKVRCIHGGVYKYPMVPLIRTYKGHNHCLKLTVTTWAWIGWGLEN